MKKIILLISLFLGGFSFIGISFAEDYLDKNDGGLKGFDPSKSMASESTIHNGVSHTDKCIPLNTDVPGLSKCIKQNDAAGAFGKLMGAMMKILINMTVAISFIALIAAGVMMSLSGVSQSTAGKGKELIKKVILGIVLLGLSGLILHTINPNFFKTELTMQLVQLL